jgi:glycosyltransferase involved in cell wall biosynthesis
MRILVASALEALSGWAHAINTVKMAEGFARLGHQVTIICKRSPEGKVSSDQLAEVYGLTEPVAWVQLPRKFLHYNVDQHWLFAFLALLSTIRIKPDLIFSRNYIFPWLCCKFRFLTIAESHSPADNRTGPFLRFINGTRQRSFLLFVTISQSLAEQYHLLGVPKEKLAVLPDAVDFQLFHPPNPLPPSPYPNCSCNAVYAGHLYEDYKGIPTILQAASVLPDIHFQMLGGSQEKIVGYQKLVQDLGLKNVIFHGLKSHSAVPPYLWHADVLLMPPSQHHPSAAWTSPVKLGEYLASGSPVVATSIPALRNWLTEKEVMFVEPDNPEALANGIRMVLCNPEYAMRLTQNGIVKARTLSYGSRARKILERLEPL